MTGRKEPSTPALCGTQASSILARYSERTTASAEAHARAERYLPGGNSRQASYWRPYPVTLERGQGTHVWDLDGNRYIDLINNYTAMVHGHAFPPVVEAVDRQVRGGTGWAASCRAQTDLAAQLAERVPSVEQVRFTNSGTEAGNLALMIARVVTGRDKVLMARYGYHGSVMEFEVGSFGSEGPMTYIARYNDPDDFQAVLDRHGDEIAAVFVEPVQGPGGVVPGNADFLSKVRDAAHKAGALFVLDEVLTFRFAPGGCQSNLGIEPDLTMFGKLIGGGFPVGAVGGAKEYLAIFDPADLKAYHTGTYNANPVTMIAGDITVRELTAGKIAGMDALCAQLKAGLEGAAQTAGLPLSIRHYGSVMNLYFSPAPPESAMVRDDNELMDRFHLASMNHGLFLAARGMIAMSSVMTPDTVSETLERATAALADVAREIV
ncbi:MAG: aspartate aminotransferase family protein [Sphingomonadales bacterium]